MATRDRQKQITSMVAEILGEPAKTEASFDWLVNKHLAEHFGKHYQTIDGIFRELGGDAAMSANKRTARLVCDAYFGGSCNFMFEFDEVQHFSSFRLRTFDYYPEALRLNYDIADWQCLCLTHHDEADRYRRSKMTIDFDCEGGRTAQRAYLDCFRDFLPELHGLNPTLRINEFEVADIVPEDRGSYRRLETVIKRKLYGG